MARNPQNFTWPENSDSLNDAIGKMTQQVIANRMSIREAIAFGEKTYNELRR